MGSGAIVNGAGKPLGLTEGLSKFVSFGGTNPSTTQGVVPLPLQGRLVLFCDFSAV